MRNTLQVSLTTITLRLGQGYIEHRDCLLKLATDNSGVKQKVTLYTFFSYVNGIEAQKQNLS